MKGKRPAGKRVNDLGVSIIIVAVGMIFVLGMAGLGIDLASLYVGRSEAQRSADAAALAGAQYFATSGCASGMGGTISSTCQTIARERAEAAGDKNLIAGVSPGIQDSDITFPSISTSDPQIRVVAARNTAHNNPMPTFFVRIFGIDTANVSAAATAEAYNATAQGTPVGTNCLKPWLIPNCDAYDATSNPNPECTNPDGGYYINPTTLQIVDPTAVGRLITIKPGNPSKASGPSKFYPVFIPAGTVASSTACPSCSTGQTSSGSQSGDQYRQNIECCIQQPIVCQTYSVQSVSGNMVGPTDQGVECLIHETNNGTGQDIYDPSTGVITAGWNNPYNLTGSIATSDSIVTLPIYEGTQLCPGGSSSTTGQCQPTNVRVLGFMQLFIASVGAPQASVNAYIMSIVSCLSGTGGSGTGTGGTGGGSGPIISTSGSAIPVRLIQ